MNKCLNCGKEIPEGRKFCSRSCSASYNNVRRERKPWTEEQRKAITGLKRTHKRVQQVCAFCGKPLGREVWEERRAGLCSDCKPYYKVNLYTKLGLQEGSLKSRYEKALKILAQMYFEDRMSLPEIEEKTGVNVSTVRKLLTGEVGSLRSRANSQEERILQGKAKIRINPEYKHGWYETWEGKKVFYRSSWELEYMLQLDEQKIRYDVEDLRIQYFDSQEKKKRVAIPDFHLLESNEIVEIKSTWTFNEQNMKDKFQAYRKAGYSPILILDKKLQKDF